MRIPSDQRNGAPWSMISADHALAAVRDIEDLGALGARLGVCPYYASRSALAVL